MVDTTGFFAACDLKDIPLVQRDTTMLLLASNYISEINSTSFPFLEDLLVLKLEGQQTKKLTIQNHSFRNLPNLQMLDVSYNMVLILDPEAFAGLLRLQTLLLYSNNLNGSILESDYFKDLLSLEYVDLSSNAITYLKPHPLFYYLHSFHLLSLKFNQISRICEGDLHSFERKYITVMDFSVNRLYTSETMDWENCGKPFRNIDFDTLTVSSNGFNVDTTQHFCNSLHGSKIKQLKLSSHIMGPGFGYHNFKDPDNNTFVGLEHSDIEILDLSSGSIFSLNPDVFAKLSTLLLLNLAKNKINQIERYAFHGLDRLEHLNLSYNLLGHLYDDSFDGLARVRHIYLQQNNIGPIQGDTFRKLKNLEFLDLTDNAIKTLRFCESIPFVKILYLVGNKLEAVDSHVNTAFLDLTGNIVGNLGVLHKLAMIPTLQVIMLKWNKLSFCETQETISKNNSLAYLDLSDNMIQLVWEKAQCLNIFQNLSLLQILVLSNNHFRFLPQGLFNELSSLRTLNLSFNSLTYLLSDALPSNLETLDLSNNQLLSPNPQIFASLKALDITSNHFICDCNIVRFVLWLNQTNTTFLGVPNNIYCMFPPELIFAPLHTLPIDNCDEDLVLLPLRFSLFVLTSLVIVTLMMSVIAYTQFRGLCFGLYKRMVQLVLGERNHEDISEICQYDAYLCYSKKDFQWVQSTFLENLDSQYCEKNRFSLCFEERDFVPGEDHIMNIRHAIWNSRKTICIVTKQFLADGWCVEAFNCAQSRYFTELKDVLIMVVVGSLSPFQMKRYEPIRAFVQRSPYLKWPEDYQDIDWFLSRLSHKILQKQKVDKKDLKVLKKTSNLELQRIATIS
ncbi:toll-like receptor 5 [Pelodytes ibericus]